MDADSPDKAVEGIRGVDKFSSAGNLDSSLFADKDDQKGKNLMCENEVPNNGTQIYLDQEYSVSPDLHAGVDNERLQSPVMNSNSVDLSSPAKNRGELFLPVESELNHDGMEKRFHDYGTEEQIFSINDYQSNGKKQSEDADHIALPGDFLDNNVNETYNNEFHTEDSYPSCHSSILPGDNNSCYEIRGDETFNQQIHKSPALDEADSGDDENAPANAHSEKPDVHGEMDGRSSSPHTEMKKEDYTVTAASENGGMVWENSSLHSPERTQNASPSPERQFSISAERSPRTQQYLQTHPSSGDGVQSPANIDKKPAPLASPSRIKHSASPEKHSGSRKGHPSRGHSSPTRRKSPSERTMQRDSRQRDGSPRIHTAPSPRRRDSPRRRGRSTSHSPMRRRDSPGQRRDRHRRSRSRSPHARDRYRRSPPRRRPSPRRRSPAPGRSRRRSPRRPWSPPPNRNTGLGKPGNNLFVAGFSYATTERDLEKKFSRFGRVTDVRIVRERRSGESRGFGFLSLERDEDADAAIRAVDQTEWNGRVILVEKSKTSTR